MSVSMKCCDTVTPMKKRQSGFTKFAHQLSFSWMLVRMAEILLHALKGHVELQWKIIPMYRHKTIAE